jgi:hypothetical protein
MRPFQKDRNLKEKEKILILEKIQNLIERAIAADPTYLDPYQSLITLTLLKNPQEKNNPYFSQIVEINKRILEHIPDEINIIQYFFDYHISNNEPETAQTYFEKLEALNPLSVTTFIQKYRLQFAQIRKALKEKDVTKAEQCLWKLQASPALNTFFYRFDILTLAFTYLCHLLQGQKENFSDYVQQAKKIGMEKPLPLIFAVLVEGWECGMSGQDLQHLETDWSKGISGRCNSNTAGILGDLAMNVISLKFQHPKTRKIIKDACHFINRAGQVKWNNEKDLFCACQLLWMLAVEKKEKEEYEKTFKILTQKGIKQYPNSLFFTFFSIEKDGMDRFKRYGWQNKILDRYHEFMKKFASYQDDPECAFLIQTVEQRIKKLERDDGFGFYDEDWDDDDWDDDDWDDDDWDDDDDD